MKDTILFDLDGTLLPMDQETFIRAYFTQLVKRFAPLGYTKEELIDGVWKGTYAMIGNDGTMTNRERFWQVFSARIPRNLDGLEEQMNDFYGREFDAVREIAHPNGLARPIIDTLKAKGYTLILATNPVFPPVAVKTRLGWIDLKPEDFSLVTTYDNSRFCKPNPRYFEEILKTIGKTPDQCRMIGNNTSDDMSAATLGVEPFLVTDFLENEKQLDLAAFPHGTLEDVKNWAETLPALG